MFFHALVADEAETLITRQRDSFRYLFEDSFTEFLVFFEHLVEDSPASAVDANNETQRRLCVCVYFNSTTLNGH